MVNPKWVLQQVEEMASLKYFPTQGAALLSIGRLVCDMAENEEQVRWLVKRMTSGIYSEWPGPGELRACFCSRFRPRDGIDRCSEVYEISPPDPSAKLAPALPKQLAAGELITADPVLDAAVGIAFATQSLKQAPLEGKATPQEIATAPEWLRRMEGYE